MTTSGFITILSVLLGIAGYVAAQTDVVSDGHRMRGGRYYGGLLVVAGFLGLFLGATIAAGEPHAPSRYEIGLNDQAEAVVKKLASKYDLTLVAKPAGEAVEKKAADKKSDAQAATPAANGDEVVLKCRRVNQELLCR